MRLLYVVLLLSCALWTEGAAQTAPSPEPDARQIAALIKQLGAQSFAVREAASAKLYQIGAVALPQLRQALQSAELEVQTRARALLNRIEVFQVENTYFHIRMTQRARMLRANGGGPDTQAAVDRALTWLARHQSASGQFDADGFHAQCAGPACSGGAKLSWVDPGVTGLAALAFLGAGHTHRAGKYKAQVKKLLRYLMQIQSADGLFGPKIGRYIYNHAICAMALAEVYGMTRSPLVKGSALKAIEWLVKAQNPGIAWRYTPRDGDNDVSVTSWCVMAIRAAQAAGLPVRASAGRSSRRDGSSTR